jgi:uncharacterized membrane protein
MSSFGMTGSDSRQNSSEHTSRSLRHRTRKNHETNDTNVGTIERWGSVISGAVLATYGLKRRSLGGVTLALLGGGLMYRGMTGDCQLYQALGISTARDSGATSVIEVEKAVTIDKPAEELYRFWRHLENLPRFMLHLQSVQSTDSRQSHWVARAPLGTTAEWDAEITEERDNELIAWRSLEGAHLPNQGWVRFQRAPGGRGTEVRVMLAYRPPLGKLGATIAKLFGEEPNQQLEEDLRRLKCLMEAGEIPTIEGQPSGRVRLRREDLAWHSQRAFKPSPGRSVVEEASLESFPTSNAPAWTFRSEGNEAG